MAGALARCLTLAVLAGAPPARAQSVYAQDFDFAVAGAGRGAQRAAAKKAPRKTAAKRARKTARSAP